MSTTRLAVGCTSASGVTLPGATWVRACAVENVDQHVTCKTGSSASSGAKRMPPLPRPMRADSAVRSMCGVQEGLCVCALFKLTGVSAWAVMTYKRPFLSCAHVYISDVQ